MDEATDRRNGNRFLWANLMIYLAAPVYYVDVTQAALCNKLGASATVANLPAAFNLLGNFSPIVFACLVPHRLERRMSALPYALAGGLFAAVGLALVAPISDPIRIAAVILECLMLGVLNGAGNLFMMQCLGRGTSEWGRARALKLAFGFGPIAAVAGALGEQFILRGGIPRLSFPWNFAVIHLYAVPCALVTAWNLSRMELSPMPEEPRKSFFPELLISFRQYFRSGTLIKLGIAYFLWSCALYAMANLSLYTKETIGRDPSQFSGLILAIRFGAKALAGFGLGALYVRWGFRAPLLATTGLVALGMLWAWDPLESTCRHASLSIL